MKYREGLYLSRWKINQSKFNYSRLNTKSSKNNRKRMKDFIMTRKFWKRTMNNTRMRIFKIKQRENNYNNK